MVLLIIILVVALILIIHVATKKDADILIDPNDIQHFNIKDKGNHISVWPKGQGIGDYIEFPIAGLTYAKNIGNYIGEFVGTLDADPTNPYDSNAIKVLAPDGHQVGYVPKNQTHRIRNFTSLPCSCFCFIGINNGTYFSDCYITRK